METGSHSPNQLLQRYNKNNLRPLVSPIIKNKYLKTKSGENTDKILPEPVNQNRPGIYKDCRQ